MKISFFLLLSFVTINSYRQNSGVYNRTAIINDPDGYTNVREEPNRNARIVAKLYDNEKFKVEKSDNEWWRVLTKSGVAGYMHKSRVQLLSDDNNGSASFEKKTAGSNNSSNTNSSQDYSAKIVGVWQVTTLIENGVTEKANGNCYSFSSLQSSKSPAWYKVSRNSYQSLGWGKDTYEHISWGSAPDGKWSINGNILSINLGSKMYGNGDEVNKYKIVRITESEMKLMYIHANGGDYENGTNYSIYQKVSD